MSMPTYSYADTAEVADLVRNGKPGKDYVVVDVRDSDYEGGNIPAAWNYPSEHFYDTLDELISKTEDSEFECPYKVECTDEEIRFEVPKVIVRQNYLSSKIREAEQRGPKMARIYAEELSRRGSKVQLEFQKEADAQTAKAGTQLSSGQAEGDVNKSNPPPKEVIVLRGGFTRWQEKFRDQDFQDLIKRTMQRWNISGVSVGVVDVQGGIVDVQGYGAPPSGSVAPLSIFQICSNTKFFTVIGLAILVEEGKLGWDSIVSQILPSLKLQDEYANRILTVADFITHQTGIDSMLEWEADCLLPASDAIQFVNGLPLAATPRQQFRYSNSAYSILGEIIRVLSGAPYSQFIRERILEPLGMSQTTFGKPILGANIVTPSVSIPGGDCQALNNVGFLSVDLDTLGSSGGGLLSSGHDVTRWQSYLIRLYNEALLPEDPRIIKSCTLKDILRGRVLSDNQLGIGTRSGSSSFPEMSPPLYALGQYTMHYRGYPVIWHGGSGVGAGSILAWLPEHQFAVAVLTNVNTGGWECALPIIASAIDKHFNLSRIDWNERISQFPECQNNIAATPPIVESPMPCPFWYHDLVGKYTCQGVGSLHIVSPDSIRANHPDYIQRKAKMLTSARPFGPTYDSRKADLLCIWDNDPVFFGYAAFWHVSDGTFWGHRYCIHSVPDGGMIKVPGSVFVNNHAGSLFFRFDQRKSGQKPEYSVGWLRTWNESPDNELSNNFRAVFVRSSSEGSRA